MGTPRGTGHGGIVNRREKVLAFLPLSYDGPGRADRDMRSREEPTCAIGPTGQPKCPGRWGAARKSSPSRIVVDAR
ncbi:hypothetical protein B7494_g8392 [Chlorociboria aeruginascens]|nr:hypothetical protein B7494_g8392 [Chlorociboria aeruginascens]